MNIDNLQISGLTDRPFFFYLLFDCWDAYWY